MELYKLMTIMDHLETYVEKKVEVVTQPKLNHAELNKARTALLDCLDLYFGDRGDEE